MFSHVTLLSLAVFATVASAQTCYGLDGTQLDNTFAPCKSNTNHSACCATKRSSNPDICLDSGLCMSTEPQFMGMTWQNGCTDITGKDVACPKICPDVTTSFTGLIPVPAWNVQQCDYGTYCCRAPGDRTSCCNNDSAPKVTMPSIGAFQSHPVANITPSTTPTPSQAVASAVSTGTPFPAPGPDVCDKEHHQTAVVGGALGAIFGAIIIAMAGAMFWMHKKEARQRRLKEHYEEQFAQTTAYRRTIASSAVSLMTSELEEVKTRAVAVAV